jgi:hypothetical protein
LASCQEIGNRFLIALIEQKLSTRFCIRLGDKFAIPPVTGFRSESLLPGVICFAIRAERPCETRGYERTQKNLKSPTQLAALTLLYVHSPASLNECHDIRALTKLERGLCSLPLLGVGQFVRI